MSTPLAENGNRPAHCQAGATPVNQGDILRSLVRRIDQLMYWSKQRGKNCLTAV